MIRLFLILSPCLILVTGFLMYVRSKRRKDMAKRVAERLMGRTFPPMPTPTKHRGRHKSRGRKMGVRGRKR